MTIVCNWKPDCLHAEPKGRLAPVRADYWRCGVRGRDVYNRSDCEKCPAHKPRAARPANKEQVTAMPKQRNIQWDQPANLTIPEGPASKPLWEYCQSLGNAAAARRLGLASSSVSVAISKRAKAQAAAPAIEPAPAPETAPEPDLIEDLSPAPAPAPVVNVNVAPEDDGQLAAAVKQAMAKPTNVTQSGDKAWQPLPQPEPDLIEDIMADDQPTTPVGAPGNAPAPLYPLFTIHHLQRCYGDISLADLCQFMVHIDMAGDEMLDTLLEIIKDEGYTGELHAYLAGLSRGRQVPGHA